MTLAQAFPFPGSRILAAWWRDLAPWQPRQFWIAHLLLHRVEALVLRRQAVPCDPIRLAVLRALALGAPSAVENYQSSPSTSGLLERLHLDRRALTSLLGTLAGAGLVRAEAAGKWSLTDSGRDVLTHGAAVDLREERRTFYFAHPSSAVGAPHFLALNRPVGAALSAPPEWHFDVRTLHECVRREPDWKTKHRFPLDVEAILGADGPAASPNLDYRRVILDRPEHLPLALVLVRNEGSDSVLGFSFQPSEWGLRGEEPALALGPEWREVLPDLAAEPPEEAWRLVWKTWCQQRAFPLAETEECEVRREEHRLVVTAPARLLERLRVARSDALRNEGWLLAGSGRSRTAALLDVREASEERKTARQHP